MPNSLTVSPFSFRVVGPPALKQFAKNWEPLPTTTRPVYNFSMKGVITCFTGIRKREELVSLLQISGLSTWCPGLTDLAISCRPD